MKNSHTAEFAATLARHFARGTLSPEEFSRYKRDFLDHKLNVRAYSNVLNQTDSAQEAYTISALAKDDLINVDAYLLARKYGYSTEKSQDFARSLGLGSSLSLSIADAELKSGMDLQLAMRGIRLANSGDLDDEALVLALGSGKHHGEDAIQVATRANELRLWSRQWDLDKRDYARVYFAALKYHSDSQSREFAQAIVDRRKADRSTFMHAIDEENRYAFPQAWALAVAVFNNEVDEPTFFRLKPLYPTYETALAAAKKRKHEVYN
jgi:hypothetical protein